MRCLIIYGNCEKHNEFFHNSEIFGLECQLTDFIINCSKPFQEHEEFIKFLQSQQKSLDSLGIFVEGRSLGIIQRFALVKLPSLKKLITSFLDNRHICRSTTVRRTRAEQDATIQKGFHILSIKSYEKITTNIESLECLLFSEADPDEIGTLSFVTTNQLPNLKYFHVKCINSILKEHFLSNL